MEGEEVKAVSFLGLVLVNHLLQQLIQIILVLRNGLPQNGTIEEIWGSKATSKKPRNSMSHKKLSGKTPSKFTILSRVKPSDFRFPASFMSFLKFDLPRSKQKLSYFEPFKSRPKWNIKTVNSCFWGKYVNKRNIKTLDSCFWGKYAKETMFLIMLQETVWALSHI